MCIRDSIKTELKNLAIKPNNVEEHSIYVEAEVEMGILVYQNRPISLIQDLYSPSIALNTNMRKNKYNARKKINERCM